MTQLRYGVFPNSLLCVPKNSDFICSVVRIMLRSVGTANSNTTGPAQENNMEEA